MAKFSNTFHELLMNYPCFIHEVSMKHLWSIYGAFLYHFLFGSFYFLLGSCQSSDCFRGKRVETNNNWGTFPLKTNPLKKY